VLALTLAACGTGGRVEQGSLDNGRQVFGAKCGGCHTLEAAGTTSEIGPNLDASFAQARSEGFDESSIRDIVAGQIREPGQYATGDARDELKANMPPDEGTGWHRHEANFQIVIMVKGWARFMYEDKETLVEAGDVVHQRPGIRHYLFDYSPDMEYLEIVSPADFKSVDVEPAAAVPPATPWE